MNFTDEEGRQLIKLARDVIESQFHDVEVNIPLSLKDKLIQPRGIFVTINKRDELRGCIGFTEPVLPLGIAVAKAAKSAAFEDPRFPPLKEEELKDIEIEISVLTLPEKIEPDPNLIKVGEDGLIVKKGAYSGLLLPQVATEYNWSTEEFLSQTCVKAGLSKDAWKEKDIEIQKFQAQIIR